MLRGNSTSFQAALNTFLQHIHSSYPSIEAESAPLVAAAKKDVSARHAAELILELFKEVVKKQTAGNRKEGKTQEKRARGRALVGDENTQRVRDQTSPFLSALRQEFASFPAFTAALSELIKKIRDEALTEEEIRAVTFSTDDLKNITREETVRKAPVPPVSAEEKAKEEKVAPAASHVLTVAEEEELLNYFHNRILDETGLDDLNLFQIKAHHHQFYCVYPQDEETQQKIRKVLEQYVPGQITVPLKKPADKTPTVGLAIDYEVLLPIARKWRNEESLSAEKVAVSEEKFEETVTLTAAPVEKNARVKDAMATVLEQLDQLGKPIEVAAGESSEQKQDSLGKIQESLQMITGAYRKMVGLKRLNPLLASLEDQQFLSALPPSLSPFYESNFKTAYVKMFENLQKQLLDQLNQVLMTHLEHPEEPLDSHKKMLSEIIKKINIVKQAQLEITFYTGDNEDALLQITTPENMAGQTPLGNVIETICMTLAPKNSDADYDKKMQALSTIVDTLGLQELDNDLPGGIKDLIQNKKTKFQVEGLLAAKIATFQQEFASKKEQLIRLRQAKAQRKEVKEDEASLANDFITFVNLKLKDFGTDLERYRASLKDFEIESIQTKVKEFVETSSLTAIMLLKGYPDFTAISRFRSLLNDEYQSKSSAEYDFRKAFADYTERDSESLHQVISYAELTDSKQFLQLAFNQLLNQYSIALKEMYKLLEEQKNMSHPESIGKGLLKIAKAQAQLSTALNDLYSYIQTTILTEAAKRKQDKIFSQKIKNYFNAQIEAMKSSIGFTYIPILEYYRNTGTSELVQRFETFAEDYKKQASKIYNAENPAPLFVQEEKAKLEQMTAEMMRQVSVWTDSHGFYGLDRTTMIESYQKRILDCQFAAISEFLRVYIPKRFISDKRIDLNQYVLRQEAGQLSIPLENAQHISFIPIGTFKKEYISLKVRQANENVEEVTRFKPSEQPDAQKATEENSSNSPIINKNESKQEIKKLVTRIDKDKIRVKLDWDHTTMSGGMVHNNINWMLTSFIQTADASLPVILQQFYAVCASYPALFSNENLLSSKPEVRQRMLDVLELQCATTPRGDSFISLFFQNLAKARNVAENSNEYKRDKIQAIVYSMFTLFTALTQFPSLATLSNEANLAARTTIQRLSTHPDLNLLKEQSLIEQLNNLSTYDLEIIAHCVLGHDVLFGVLSTQDLYFIDQMGLVNLMKNRSTDVSVGICTIASIQFAQSYQSIVSQRIEGIGHFDAVNGGMPADANSATKIAHYILDLMEEAYQNEGCYSGHHIVVDDKWPHLVAAFALSMEVEIHLTSNGKLDVPTKQAVHTYLKGKTLADYRAEGQRTDSYINLADHESLIISELEKRSGYEKFIIETFKVKHPAMKNEEIQERMDDAFKVTSKLSWTGILADGKNQQTQFGKINKKIGQIREAKKAAEIEAKKPATPTPSEAGFFREAGKEGKPSLASISQNSARKSNSG